LHHYRHGTAQLRHDSSVIELCSKLVDEGWGGVADDPLLEVLRSGPWRML